MMKKITVFVITLSIVLTFAINGECRVKNSLYDMFSKKGVVKVFVSNIDNISGNEKADLKGLRKNLEDALATRMTINFQIVNKSREADIVISCNIIEYIWTAEDPVDNIAGIASMTMDALMKEHYARMQAIFAIIAPQKGKELWKKSLKATITSKSMTEEDSVSMINERLVKIFMREAFSKTHIKSSSRHP